MKNSKTQLVALSFMMMLGLLANSCEKNGGVNGVIDLSAEGTANCYIVPKAGAYKFRMSKGNSNISVGNVSNADVLWETFGTDTAPVAGDLICDVKIDDQYISFAASELKGNAVIAAKDASGNILWSWHIWLTDTPKNQVYNNNAGIMMDRNLGATSALVGDVGALGLLYEWGRKDPFLAAPSISPSIVDAENAESTITWPDPVEASEQTGTVEYAISHPTTFIYGNKMSNYDWCINDDTRWQTEKTIYDPCPVGYRIPDEGIWAKAFGENENFTTSCDMVNMGFDFGTSSEGKYKLTDTDPVCWYPCAGRLNPTSGNIDFAGVTVSCVSCGVDSTHPDGLYCYFLPDDDIVEVRPIGDKPALYIGYSVRCMKEQ